MSQSTKDNVTNAPIGLSSGAIEEVKRLINEEQIPKEQGLRIGVKDGGCAGFSYILGFDKKSEEDEEFEIEGIKIFVNKAHQVYLAGIHIDYKEGLDARGFIFENPNASTTCGCGTSFAS